MKAKIVSVEDKNTVLFRDMPVDSIGVIVGDCGGSGDSKFIGHIVIKVTQEMVWSPSAKGSYWTSIYSNSLEVRILDKSEFVQISN